MNKFDEYERNQRAIVPVVVDGEYAGELGRAWDQDIDAPDIPKKYRDEYAEQVRTGFRYWGSAPRKPRRAWLETIAFNKKMREEAKAKREQEKQKKLDAVYVSPENRYHPFNDTPRQLSAAEERANIKAMWKFIGFFTILFAVGCVACYGMAVSP